MILHKNRLRIDIDKNINNNPLIFTGITKIKEK